MVTRDNRDHIIKRINFQTSNNSYQTALTQTIDNNRSAMIDVFIQGIQDGYSSPRVVAADRLIFYKGSNGHTQLRVALTGATDYEVDGDPFSFNENRVKVVYDTGVVTDLVVQVKGSTGITMHWVGRIEIDIYELPGQAIESGG